MHLAFMGARRKGKGRRSITRLSWDCDGGSQAFQLLRGCPVVTTDGAMIGKVDGLMVDAASHRPRYVLLNSRRRHKGAIAIPWQSLYFDSTLAHLVFYTLDD